MPEGQGWPEKRIEESKAKAFEVAASEERTVSSGGKGQGHEWEDKRVREDSNRTQERFLRVIAMWKQCSLGANGHRSGGSGIFRDGTIDNDDEDRENDTPEPKWGALWD